MTAQREFSDGELIPGTRYRVVGLIGSGGMGSVYEVEHVELGKRFVLKALLRSLTNRDDLVHRLRNEWRALGKLEHRNIVSVTDAGITTTGMPYFVMERLQGETLAVRLRRDGRIPVREALTIAADVLEGLSAAHRIGIVHRDVKPPNIFLVKKRPAKLLDFGIAKVLDPKASQITGRGIAIGTPRYMAPEQATGEAVDARTDLYAVGLILFEMIAGAGPFDSMRDPNEVFLAHVARPAPSLSSVAPFAPPALDPWLARLLAKKPTQRPDGAEAVAAALRALAAELGSSPPRPLPKTGDEQTLTGGPFDTLEAAATIPSDRPGMLSSATNTGIGPSLRTSAIPPAVSQSGQTLRLDALTSGGDAPTRTAAPPPIAAPDTPPPVTETPSPVSHVEQRWARFGLAVAGIAAVVAGAFLSARHARLGSAQDAPAHPAAPQVTSVRPAAPPPARVKRFPQSAVPVLAVATPAPAGGEGMDLESSHSAGPTEKPTPSPSATPPQKAASARNVVRAASAASRAHPAPAKASSAPDLPGSGL